MKMYPLEELLNRWAREELTIEQALGQILQHLLRLKNELDTVMDLLRQVSEKFFAQRP
jgi:hypothetical protein